MAARVVLQSVALSLVPWLTLIPLAHHGGLL